jgi:hypothetical protein
MLRQIGLAIGVAILVAIVGSAHSPAAVLRVYEHASWVIAALALAAGGIGLALLTRPGRRREAVAPAAAAEAQTP